MRRIVLTAAAVISFSRPAAASVSVYVCADAFVTVNSYEARVSVPHNDGFAFAMPLTFDGDHLRVFSPHTKLVSRDFDIAVPYVAVQFRGHTMPPDAVSYGLGSGEIACSPIR